MRRRLSPEELGDLLEQPLNAVLAVYRKDGSALLAPVWHLWRDGFLFQIPAGDRKIAMLERDPRLVLLVAEDMHPYRAIEVTGRAHLSRDDYRAVGREIVARYVKAFDPTASVDDYLSPADGVIVRVEALSTRAWDYADASYT